MIISHRHNFIFIKTRKTAGSSMEVALASHAGPDDIVTPLGPRDDIERIKLYPESHPRNFGKDKAKEAQFIDALKKGDRNGMLDAFRDGDERNLAVQRHGGVRIAKRLVDETFWRAAYKFTIERHPYEKAVSLAWFARGRRDFDEVLADVLKKDLYRNFELYTANGHVEVDFIIRYEQMDEDLAKVESAIGLPIRARLPHANANKRQDRRPASEVLTPEQKAIVYATCREEFDLMGYPR